jgi:hypothetical protein
VPSAPTTVPRPDSFAGLRHPEMTDSTWNQKGVV